MQTVLAIIATAALVLLPPAVFGQLARTSGYPAWTGILVYVPLVNVIWLLIVANGREPVDAELARARAAVGIATEQDISALIVEASRLESRGDWEVALALWDRIARLEGHQNREYAAGCARRLRKWMQQQSGG